MSDQGASRDGAEMKLSQSQQAAIEKLQKDEVVIRPAVTLARGSYLANDTVERAHAAADPDLFWAERSEEIDWIEPWDEVLRFEPRAATTASGAAPEVPVGVGSGDDVSLAERVRQMREGMRPTSFAEWLKSSRVNLPEAEELEARDLKAKLYTIGDAGRGHGMMAGVYHDGTYEWAVVYTAPTEEIVNPKRPTARTRECEGRVSARRRARRSRVRPRSSCAPRHP